MKYTFHSHFAQDIQAYISLRESIGYKLIQCRLANREFFFQHPAGGEYSAEWVQTQFFRCWGFAGITFKRDMRLPGDFSSFPDPAAIPPLRESR